MSTRSAIILKNLTTPGYTGVYCHSDGYPEGVGAMLLAHYTDPRKVEAIVALGDLSVLGEEIGEKHDFDWYHSLYSTTSAENLIAVMEADPRSKMTRAYTRDRGEKCPPAKGLTAERVESSIGHDGHVYVFENGAWTHNGDDLATILGVIATPDSPEATYPVEDWQYDVANGDTKLGYVEWVAHNVESHKND